MPKEFESKTFKTINQEMVDTLVSQQQGNTKKLTDFSEGSIIGSIFRSISSTISGMWSELESLIDGFYIETATGDLLKRRFRDFAFEMKTGTQASGTVLVVRDPGVSFTADIDINSSLFFTGNYNLEFVVISGSYTSVFGPINDIRNSKTLSVRCTSKTSEANLQAGTTLVSNNPTYSGLKFIVGSNIDSSGNVSGSPLSNGLDDETDEEARERFKTYIQNLGKGTVEIIEASVKSVSGVRACTVYDNSKVINNSIDGPETSNNLRKYPGHIVVQVQPSNIQEGLALIEANIVNAIETNKAAGIAYDIFTVPVTQIILVVTVRTTQSTLSDAYKRLIESTLETKFNSLEIDEPIRLFALQNELYKADLESGVGLVATGGITVAAKTISGTPINAGNLGEVYPVSGGILALNDVEFA